MEDSIYIKRLKERLRQDQNSKVFLSLAEELRKKDRMDEAIAVLIEGIKKHPDFIAARLALGRWYLLSDMLPEARKEYSEVIKQSPNNIFALKGIDEVNKRLGIEAGVRGQESEVRHQITEARRFEGREVVINRLNTLLERIKIHFAHSPSVVAFSLRGDKASVKNRLDSFLNAIKIHFASSNLG